MPAEQIIVTEAGEWRVVAMLGSWQTLFGLPVNICRDARIICSHTEFDAWAAGRAELTMEFFFRDMRKQTGLLLGAGKPAGGGWNFDKDKLARWGQTEILAADPSGSALERQYCKTFPRQAS